MADVEAKATIDQTDPTHTDDASELREADRETSRPLRLWPRSLTSRLVLTSIILVAAVSIVVAVGSTLALRAFLYDRLDDQLENVANRLPISPGPDGRQQLQSICDPVVDDRGTVVPAEPGAFTGSLDADCNVIVVAGNGIERPQLLPPPPELYDVATDGKPYTVDLEGLGSYRVVVTTDGTHELAAGLPTGDVDETINRLIVFETVVAVIAVAGAAAAGLILVRRQMRPLQQVASTARTVAGMPLSTGEVEEIPRVPTELVQPETEVGQVAEALNAMLGHVERSLTERHLSEQQLRQFLADASHELRTPLTTIQGYAELSRRADVASPEALQLAMSKVRTESSRMASLVEDMLLLARLDSGRPLETTEVDLGHLVLEAVNDARVVDDDHRWRLVMPEEPLVVLGDELRLHQVVSNLLTNARRHTPAGTTVQVAAERVGDLVQVRVRDDGPGMPESLRGKEFERFSRGDSSRTRTSGGAGLGLSIVHAIVVAHGGQVSVSSRPGDTTFTITLPAANS